MSGTLFVVMGSPGAGTHTVMERVRTELADSKLFAFPSVVATRETKHTSAEIVVPEEFQRRKVSGELPLFWSLGNAEVGYAPFIRLIESGVNVAIEVPQSAIAKVEKLFFYHKKHVLYVTAPEALRTQRMAAAGHVPPACVQGKPLGPDVSQIINSGTVAEGAVAVIDAMKAEGKEVITFPAAGVTVTVLRNAKNETREYLSDHVLPGLTCALDSLCRVQPKPKNPYMWLAEHLESNSNLAAEATSATPAIAKLLAAGSFHCRLEQEPHVLDEPPRLQGVSNLRRDPTHDKVVGVHQPSSAALKELVSDLCGTHGKVIWLSVRDSPVVYVNGQPHVVYSREQPDQPPLALRASCISNVQQLSKVERQLAKELTEMASEQGGSLQLFPARSTKDASNIEPDPVAVPYNGVQPMQDVFDALEVEGFDVTLRRSMLPQTGAPEPEEIDEIVSAVRAAEQSGAALVISCASGVERTELAMVMSAMMLSVQAGAQPRGYVDPIEGAANPDYESKAQYSAIVQLCQYFGAEGPIAKAIVDDIIDDHSKLIHFRQGIHSASQCANDASPAVRSKAVCVAMGKLENYWYLIAFGAYLRAQVADRYTQNFSTWLRAKRAVKRSLNKLCLV